MSDQCMENSSDKKKTRSEEEKKTFMTRINRIAGQMNGVKRMIEEDRYCVDILIQLSAIEKAVKSFSALVLEEHLQSCLVEGIQGGDLTVVGEIVELFRKF